MVIGRKFKTDRGRRWSRKRSHALILKHSRRRTCIVIPIRRRKQSAFNVHGASRPVVIDCDSATATVPVDDTVGLVGAPGRCLDCVCINSNPLCISDQPTPGHRLIQGVARQALNVQPDEWNHCSTRCLPSWAPGAVSEARRLGLAAVVCAVANDMTVPNFKVRCKKLEIR